MPGVYFFRMTSSMPGVMITPETVRSVCSQPETRSQAIRETANDAGAGKSKITDPNNAAMGVFTTGGRKRRINRADCAAVIGRRRERSTLWVIWTCLNGVTSERQYCTGIIQSRDAGKVGGESGRKMTLSCSCRKIISRRRTLLQRDAEDALFSDENINEFDLVIIN